MGKTDVVNVVKGAWLAAVDKAAPLMVVPRSKVERMDSVDDDVAGAK